MADGTSPSDFNNILTQALAGYSARFNAGGVMEGFEERALEEYIELVKKITKLARYIGKTGGDSLLYEQLELMKKYKNILKRRLETLGYL